MLSRYFDEDEILDRVPSLFIVVGVACAVMTVIGVLLLFDPPKQDHVCNYRIENNTFEPKVVHFSARNSKILIKIC
jgi:hypothetical protein